MTETDTRTGGWAFVADNESAARLIDAVLDLDASEEYTKTAIAEQSGVPLKTLYLNDLLADCVDLGLLTEVGITEDGSEACYRVNEDSDLLQAAAAFDDAFRRQRE